MKEMHGRPGPQDETNHFAANASKLDIETYNAEWLGPELPREDDFARLHEDFRLMGQEVVVGGYVVEDTGRSDPISQLTVSEEVRGSARGIYRGLRRLAIRDKGGEVHNRVVHFLELDENEIYEGLKKSINTTYAAVCAKDSRIYPVEPVNAHGSATLRDNEELIGLFEELIMGPSDPSERIRQIGHYVNNALLRGYWIGHANHGLVSLLNEEDLGTRASASDFILGDPKAGDSMTGVHLSNPSELYEEIELGKLTVLAAYERRAGKTTKPKILRHHELYFRGTFGPSPVTIPIRIR